MNSDSGIIRMLQEGEKQKGDETLFAIGEYIVIKGCVFSIQDISPERIILKPEPKEKFHFRIK